MLSDKVWKIFFLVISLSYFSGVTPYIVDKKNRTLHITQKGRCKTKFWFSLQFIIFSYLFIRTLLFRFDSNISSYNFTLSILINVVVEMISLIPFLLFDQEFQQYMNSFLRFVQVYQSKQKNGRI